MRIAVALIVILAVGCGDNQDSTTPDADEPLPLCEPVLGTLSTDGEFADPKAMGLQGCVTGGLRDAPGRWFVSDPTTVFRFRYPKLEGSCETGFRRSFARPEDHDLADDGFTFHAWSDGTILYERSRYRFEIPNEPPFEFVSASAYCMRGDGKLAGVDGSFDNDRGARTFTTIGKRFGLKDGPATGLTLLGAVDIWAPDREIAGLNVVVDGNHAYVVGFNGLDIVDVSVPTAPVHVGHVDGAFNDVRVVRGANKVVAYLAPLQDEVTFVADVTNPAAPILASTIDEYSHSLQVQTQGNNTFLYLATYTEFVPKYDVTNPLVPLRLGAARVPGEVAGVHDLTVDGDRIYANNTTAGMVAFDIAGGMAAPVELGRTGPTSYSHASWVGTAGGRPIVLHGDEGMTASPDGGAFLRVLDGDPASPTYLQVIGRYQSRPEVGIHNILMVGSKAYIAYYQDGVRIVDLSNPAQPVEVAHYNTWDPETAPGGAFEGAVGIRVANNLVFVADIDRGLLILQEQ
jgi:hypothetical protein